MKTTSNPYSGYRYPAEIISHTVWLYFRFVLSFRDVEELLAARGIGLSYETVRQWSGTLGQRFANAIRRRQGQPGDTWYMDEVSSRLAANGITCGARSIKMGMCSTSWCKKAVTSGRPNGVFASY